MKCFFVFVICMLLHACNYQPIDDFGRSSRKRTFEETDIPVIQRDIYLENEMTKRSIYRISQGFLDYLVVDTFSDTDDVFDFLRIPEQPNNYIYEKSKFLDVEKKFVECQRYDITAGSFEKKFCYISDECFEKLEEKAVDIDVGVNEEIEKNINFGFQLETMYKRQHKKRLTRAYNNQALVTSLSVNYQSILDNYFYSINFSHSINALSSIANGHNKCFGSDDPIVTLIPKHYFSTIGTSEICGKEWGYYINTSPYYAKINQAEVFLYDIEILNTHDSSRTGMKLFPVVNATFFYDYDQDLVYYANNNCFCLYSPEYALNVSYADEVDWFFNDYDEREFYVTKQHQPNPGDPDYNPVNDLGQCIRSSEFEMSGPKPRELVAQEALIRIAKALICDILPTFDLGEIYNLAAGTISKSTAISDAIIAKLRANAEDGCVTVAKTANGKWLLKEDVEQRFTEFRPNNIADCKNVLFEYISKNIILKTPDDYFSALSSLHQFFGITEDYRILLSHHLDITLGYDYSALSYITTIHVNASELVVPKYQSPDLGTIRTAISQHVVFCEEKGNYVWHYPNLEAGNYRLVFNHIDNFMSITTTFGKNVWYDIDKDTENVIVQEPIALSFSLKQKGSIGFTVSRKNFDGCLFRGSFDFILFKIEKTIEYQPEYIDVPDTISVNLIGEYTPKTIVFVPSDTAMYTFSGHTDHQGVMFSIFDSKGRILYDNVSYSEDGYYACFLLNKNNKYYITYRLGGSLNLKIFRNKYIPPYLPKGITSYRYSSNQRRVNCFLFIPRYKYDCEMWYSSGGQTIRIYDEKLTLLKSVQGKMTFTFDANKLYLIYIKFPINDNNVLQFASLTINTL